MNIAFIPIDNRPVCYLLPKQIADIDGNINLILPERKFLGDLTKYSNTEAIFDWLKNLSDIDAIVMCLDTIAYGGLISSRRNPISFKEIKDRIFKLKKILKEKNAEIYAFSSIMRISNNNVNQEEKEYWSDWGKKIFEYSYNFHKNSSCETDIPQEILDDYLKTRKRNFEINKIYLNWKNEGFFNTLVFSKDDCAEYGLNVMEAQELKKLGGFVKTGADEIPITLLARAVINSGKWKVESGKFSFPSSPQPSPSRGEGACHESFSTLQPSNFPLSLTLSLGEGTAMTAFQLFSLSTQTPPHPNPLSHGKEACYDNLSTLQPFNLSNDNDLFAYSPIRISPDTNPSTDKDLSPQNSHTSIKIAPIFLAPEHKHLISNYEDISIEKSVLGQLELAGCKVCEPQDADILLYINNFEDHQGEIVMKIPTKPYDGNWETDVRKFGGQEGFLEDRKAGGQENRFVSKEQKAGGQECKPVSCHCEEGDSPTWQSINNDSEKAGLFRFAHNDNNKIVASNDAPYFETNFSIDKDSPYCPITLSSQNKPYLIADVRYANGADNAFVEKLFEAGFDENFLGYSAWNTSANTLGSLICQGVVAEAKMHRCIEAKLFNDSGISETSQQPQTDKDLFAYSPIRFSPDNNPPTLLSSIITRFLDDWAYQANVRQMLTEPDSQKCKELMKPFEERLWKIFGIRYNVNYKFPWNRLFEVEIELS